MPQRTIAAAAEAASPPPPTTVRRNPPRRARPPPTPLASAKPKPSSLSRLLDDEAAAAAASIPPPHPPTAIAAPSSLHERLKVFLRIRPLPERDRSKVVSRPVAAKDARRKPKQPGPGGVCLVATGATSVALTVPQAKLVDPKRGRTEVFDGFSAVFSPDSSQLDIFTQVMKPLVDDFLGGKSALLVAMGPTGSGKTHTIFGSPRNPGILPLTLQKIFNATDQSKVGRQPTRSFSLSIFEILSEGKGERILDLLSDAAECILQQSTIKGLQEVAISNLADAERLVSLGMLRRNTAVTNANSTSSRSQCIITIRAVHKSIDVENEHSLSSAVLTIADLAGAERERKTGNQGSMLLQSNFINNTSMVFSLCLRSLLEHQKNQKKPLEKHFKNSMLTRYLRDYLEGKKKMTLILNVKPGDDDYLDASFLLRQASPYMKIKYTSLEDSSDLVSQKRSTVSLICQENKKKRKVHRPEVLMVERKENIDTDHIIKVSERDEARHKFLNSELRRVSRSEEIMTKFARALWTVLKQYKHKLLESENAAESMKQLITDKDIQIMELKKELEVRNSCCSCKNFHIIEATSVEQDDAVSSGQAARSLVSLSNKPELGSPDAADDNFHLVVEEEEFRCHGPESSSAHCGVKGESDNCDTSAISLIDEQELSSRGFKPEKSYSPDALGLKFDMEKGNTEVEVQVVHKELDVSESFTEQTSAHASVVTPASSHSDNPSDQSLTEHHTLLCLKTERSSLSPQFTSCSRKATIEQREEETEELSKITVEGIPHDIHITEVKHPDSLSSSQQVNSDTEDVSSSELQHGMVASQKKPEELDPESERCEAAPAVEVSIVEYGCSRPPEQTNDRGGMLPCLAKEIASPAKASMMQLQNSTGVFSCTVTFPPKGPSNKDSQAEEVADRNDEDPFASRPRNTKKSRSNSSRRLQPVASMMLKEFAGAEMDNMDTKREERGSSKSWSEEATGKSDALIQLLKGRRA